MSDLIESARAAAPTWVSGGGELGELIRAKAWSGTPLGPLEGWPQSLRSAVSILLPSKAQICLFWGTDLVTIYNDAYRPALGMKHPWALGRPAREVWSEFWEDVLRGLFESVLRTGEALRASDYPFALERHGYPEETYFDISYDPVRDESGGVGGIFCIVGETTARVLGERRLRTLRDLSRAASEARSVEEVLVRASAVVERNPHDLPFALLTDAAGKGIAACRTPVRDDWPVDRARGGEVVLQDAEVTPFGPLPGGPWPEAARIAVLLPVAAAGQPPFGFLVAGVSPRLALDDAYRDFLRLVASTIGAAMSSARALEDQKAQADALAELDRAKTAFFSNVSHEFRTPLTLLLGPLQDALSASPISEAQREGLETARRNSLRLLKLVNTLLDFSRIEAGRAQATYHATDLATFTAQLASNFRSACDKAGLWLRVDTPSLSRPVYVDPGMWEKIVLNLLSNALKFTFDGGIEVTLREGEGEAVLCVRDTGIGISATDLARLFERFYRVEGARARTHEGSGIGLAFVRELARMHGGEISAQSEVGRGSTFTVTVPFGTSHLPRGRVAAQTYEAAGTPGVASAFVEEAMGWLPAAQSQLPVATPAEGEIRLLVVDDNADMRAYVARVLGARWTVETANNGRQALELLSRRAFDLVISDVMMPELDGFALVERIRAQPSTADMPVVLLSARAGEESRIDGLSAGADDYVVKPFTAQQLLAQVGAQLKVRQARRAGQLERERQRENLFSLFMKAPNPIVILRGGAYVIELANPPACDILGKRAADLVGCPLYDAVPELHGQGFKDLLDGVMQTGVPYEGKETPASFCREDGTTVTMFFNFVYTPLRNVDNVVSGILVTAFDVTDEVRARQQMSDLHARSQAESRSKDEFLAMLSHELRNPLAALVSAAHVMRLRGVEPPELGIVERQSAHLTRLVDDLLDVSRITRGKIELRLAPVEVAEALDSAMEMARPLLDPRKQVVRVDVPRGGLTVMADRERLAQILFNLLSNAGKYSAPGSTIDVFASRDDHRVRIGVRDEGCGIAPEMQERIFDLFVQQEQTIARAEGGLGLGLTIVRSLIQLHGGRVCVHSDGMGRGAEFTVELPVAQPEARGPAAHHPARPAPSRRILVVDDNVDASTVLAALLEMQGHEVEVAHDGVQALRAATDWRPDVALIDIGLPGMDGYEVARQLKAQPATRAIELVAVTGYGLDRDRERSAEAGFSEHLVKPVDLDQLERLLTVDPAQPI